VILVDTQGQRLRRRDEMLGINSYMAHLGKCIELARRAATASSAWCTTRRCPAASSPAA
jgi:hypothetical protein